MGDSKGISSEYVAPTFVEGPGTHKLCPLPPFLRNHRDACGVDDGPLISFSFPIPFSEWVITAGRYWVTLAKRPNLMGDFAPQTPQDLSQFSSRVDGFSFAVIRDCRTMEGLDRRIGQRRDATRAPTQARSGWRPSGRLLDSPPHHLRKGKLLPTQSGPPQDPASGVTIGPKFGPEWTHNRVHLRIPLPVLPNSGPAYTGH